MKRINGGIAAVATATSPGTLPMPNSITTGTRYTKVGVVCITSSTGRTTIHAPGLRAHQMPIGIPITAQNTMAVVISDSVVIASDHTPSTAMVT
ncbi:hypothetical protein D3C85_1624010 [compost metagenome]